MQQAMDALPKESLIWGMAAIGRKTWSLADAMYVAPKGTESMLASLVINTRPA